MDRLYSQISLIYWEMWSIKTLTYQKIVLESLTTPKNTGQKLQKTLFPRIREWQQFLPPPERKFLAP